MFNIKNKLKSLKKKGKYGAMYMSTVVKVIACVVVGALVISGLAIVTNGAFNTASDKVSTLFEEDYNYAGGAHGGAGGGGAIVPGEGSSAVEITPADGTSVNKAIANKFAFNSSAPIKTVKVDSEVVDPSSYELSEDSATVTFNKSFLSSLAVGTHTVEISTDEGTANTTFAVDWVAGLYDKEGNLKMSWDELKNKCPKMFNADFTATVADMENGCISYFPEGVGYFDGTVVISSEIKEIGDFTFSECCISKVMIPDSVTKIGNKAFAYCNGLTDIVIPDNVTELGYETFDICSQLKSITIPNSVIYIGNGAFSSCFSLTDVYYKGTIDEWNSIDNICNVNFYGENEITIHCTDGELVLNA